MQTVVITDAITKYKINIGKALFKLKPSALPLSFALFFARAIASIKVIGIIASVRVSFTVTALCSVSLPRFHILSQVDAAAVTDDVSLIAVPAKIPNASPALVSNPIALPSIGKKIAASTLKKKMTEMDCATSLSSAPMTGAVAAIAEPPQIDEPTPTRIAVSEGTRSALCSAHASRRDIPIVQTMIGSDCFPVSKMTPRFRPNPSSTTAVCKMILDVHLIPAAALPLSLQKSAISMPNNMESTGPPIIGNALPSSHAGTAMPKQTKMPV